jgi:hypothetical protein
MEIIITSAKIGFSFEHSIKSFAVEIQNSIVGLKLLTKQKRINKRIYKTFKNALLLFNDEFKSINKWQTYFQ